MEGDCARQLVLSSPQGKSTVKSLVSLYVSCDIADFFQLR